MIDYILANPERIVMETLNHIWLVALPVTLAILVAVPLGVFLTRFEKLAQLILGLAGVVQTIPGIALLIIVMAFVGLGNKPAIVALFLYSILPILRNTYTGIKGVDKFILEAGRGMGMTGTQLLIMVELPISFPVIMAGIRTATVVIIGWAVLAAWIGGSGLGRLIVAGLGTGRMDLVWAGTLPAALLAFLADLAIGKLERVITPRGLKL